MDKKSPDEMLEEVKIHQVERDALDRVFSKFVSMSDDPTERSQALASPKEQRAKREEAKFSWQEVAKVLRQLGCPLSKSEVQLMIWEVDEDLDECVSKLEFDTMYKRCVNDKTGLEPRKLFDLVQFMMYDKTFKGSITVEDTLQLLFVRNGKTHLETEIRVLFGEEETTSDGQEKSITFQEYLQRVNARDIERRKKNRKARKA